MPTYIHLVHWTQQGIQNVKESPLRIEALRQFYREMGAELKTLYLTLGQYDLVAIVEAPDDETIAKLALIVGSRGNARTETLRAFTEQEYWKIIAALP